MSRSQTNVWASCSRPFPRRRTCTSIRTTALGLKTRELACGNFKLAWTTITTILLRSPLLPPSPSYLSVVASREFETVTCVIHPLHIVLTWKVKLFVAILKNRGTRPELRCQRPCEYHGSKRGCTSHVLRLTTVVRASEPQPSGRNLNGINLGWYICSYLQEIRLGTKPESASGQIFTNLGGNMMSFKYIGHMAVEAEEALKDQTLRISVQNIFLFTAFSRFKGIFGGL